MDLVLSRAPCFAEEKAKEYLLKNYVQTHSDVTDAFYLSDMHQVIDCSSTQKSHEIERNTMKMNWCCFAINERGDAFEVIIYEQGSDVKIRIVKDAEKTLNNLIRKINFVKQRYSEVPGTYEVRRIIYKYEIDSIWLQDIKQIENFHIID